MFEANSERSDRPEEAFDTGGHQDTEGSAHDGLTAQDDGEFDIDDDLFAELNGLVRQSEAAAAENGSGEGNARTAVALLERPVEEDSVEDPREGQGTIYYSRSRTVPDREQEGPVRRAPGAGGPPLPPRPPRSGDGPSSGDESGGGEGGDPSGSDASFSWLAPSDSPHPAEPVPASMEFVPETTMLRRMELLTRIGALVNYREGVEAGRQEAQAIRERERAEAHEPRHAASTEPVVAEPPQTIEFLLSPPAVVEVPPEVSAPVEAPEPAKAQPEPLTELQQRQQRASQGPNYYSGPPDDILERIRAGLRRDDVGRGQADPTIKDRAKGIEVEEVTPEEIEAAGGDVMAARAEKIARIQAEQRRQQGQ